MKTGKITLGITLVAIAGSIFLGSCRKKEKAEEKDTDTTAASDQSIASSISNDMASMSDEAATSTNTTLSSYKVGESDGILATSCATVTSVTSGSTKTITVNFGTTNCTCKDNRLRRGSLTITMSGPYLTQGTVINVTPNNYYVDNNQVTGSKTITNNGLNSSNNLVFSITADLTIIKANGAGTISWHSDRQREWTAGASTPLVWSDDVYSVTGSASGSNSNGGSFTSNITTALIRKMSCPRHFVSGVIEHTPAGKATRTINYGDGTCDNNATVTINAVTYTITLP